MKSVTVGPFEFRPRPTHDKSGLGVGMGQQLCDCENCNRSAAWQVTIAGYEQASICRAHQKEQEQAVRQALGMAA